ncbi:hypothetical protein [Nesterenkonia alkaliphila]|uniref:Uncharacterized protein n=1 Tax=Nesterenkonia alkaliphila TaxID=1463631 RepID=A0A7K1UJJ3_9MICC|nr:hypothetical protein [Nesterenkonia alkaliphila]MVT26649.1 hypothetical protein [Nesterenkonia alkaliphila]GFZ78051.1 hypothetical protein GCM10011359_02770 [Nesterenkonia alkaliphila]
MSNQTYSWLPDRHLGVAATLAHTDETIAQIAEILYSYQAQSNGILQLDEVPGPTHSQTVVTGIAPIPRKVPLLVADALVTLRNAIEHTLFTEIQHCDGELDEKAARTVEMPAALTYDAFQQWVKARAKNGPPSLRRGSHILRRIEGLQPFHRLRDPQNHPLALLALHTNHSKHRAPAITAVRLGAIHREDRTPPSPANVEYRPEVPLQVGDVIAETPIGRRVPVALFPTIGINRPRTDCWPVLIKELDELSTWVRVQAVPRLVTGTESSAPALPHCYTINVGHNDERDALAAGSTVSASQRHNDRLSAETARGGLCETLSMMDHAPDAEQIAVWLQSLSDQEVLAWMRRLRATLAYEPETMLSNFAILEKMRDEARLHAGLEPGLPS